MEVKDRVIRKYEDNKGNQYIIYKKTMAIIV